MSNSDLTVIAIDGPSASGKSTVARGVALALSFNYVDSGALYRGLTWKALRTGTPTDDPQAVIDLVYRLDVQPFVEERAVRYSIDGEDPGNQVRSVPVQERVSDLAAVPEVRQVVVRLLRAATRFGSLVMEGRDIGTVVFPDAPFKIYLDADPEERARRRHQELAHVVEGSTVDNVLDSLKRRDQKDTTRKTAPLQIALGALVIDSTTMQAEAVVERVVALVRQAGG